MPIKLHCHVIVALLVEVTVVVVVVVAVVLVIVYMNSEIFEMLPYIKGRHTTLPDGVSIHEQTVDMIPLARDSREVRNGWIESSFAYSMSRVGCCSGSRR
jgi:hypothetical protein